MEKLGGTSLIHLAKLSVEAGDSVGEKEQAELGNEAGGRRDVREH